MDNLVERLRHPIYITHAVGQPTPHFDAMQSERNEAAAEIERLQRLVITLQKQFDDCSRQFVELMGLNAKLLEQQTVK